MSFPTRAGACAGLLACAIAAQAQSPTQPQTLREVTVTANPLGDQQPAAPVSTLSGDGLLLRRQSSLGETLNSLPGVSSTYFGPTASRPVIRGMDGDHIRILENSGAMHDASSVSYDHAVSIDPLAVDRIEVLRGPGALLYGGNAIGGVVNLVDGRIPTEPIGGVTGKAEVSGATGSRERSGSAMVEGGNDRIGLHADAFDRRNDDVRVPLSLACARSSGTTTASRLCNSDGQARGGAVGGSLFFDRGYAGLSASSSESSYGSVAEADVRLRMRSQRVAFESLVRQPLPGFESVKVQASGSRYHHTEFEDGVPGTTFRSNGDDLRIEARHAPIGPLRGLIGLQAENATFSAQGAEAFVPPSDTRQRALFLYEAWPQSWGQLTAGLRRESVDVSTPGDPVLARFAPARRSFSPTSASLGAEWNVAPAWQLTGSLGRTERAPKDYELFANGPHVATGAYEVGQATLGTERATSAEAAVQWKSGADRARVGAYQTRFSRYVALLSTGITRDASGNGAGVGVTNCGDGTSVESGCTEQVLPEFAYQAVAARFRGIEAEGNVRLLRADPVLDLEWRADLVRADNLTLGQPLPRIAPARAGATLVWTQGAWGARFGFDAYARQSRVPVGDVAVAGYTLWNAALTYKTKAGPAELMTYVRLDNLTDRLAYSATSILTQSLPGRVPLPGRSLRIGLRADF
ncbi:TonB-dependent receptor [Ramlibacter humi]|uniref:TonB-dependent receptor n=1 Tax=Ramlibacter humi TaxID=2530451 RepID=A0A4Z0BQ78_9BURK|nr:TonB-dependent receptor [Ramlibacter humi]TFZ00149.1 TonB-dependent receptor [Ramlibacter humi]